MRFAALRQLVRELTEKENTFEDKLHFAEDRLRIAMSGHLSPECAAYASSDVLGFVDDEQDLTDDVIADAFISGVRSLESSGAEKSGLDPTFLRHVHGHYRSCPACRASMHEEIRGLWKLALSTRALIEAAKEEDPEVFEALRSATDKLLRHH